MYILCIYFKHIILRIGELVLSTTNRKLKTRLQEPPRAVPNQSYLGTPSLLITCHLRPIANSDLSPSPPSRAIRARTFCSSRLLRFAGSQDAFVRPFPGMPLTLSSPSSKLCAPLQGCLGGPSGRAFLCPNNCTLQSQPCCKHSARPGWRQPLPAASSRPTPALRELPVQGGTPRLAGGSGVPTPRGVPAPIHRGECAAGGCTHSCYSPGSEPLCKEPLSLHGC